MDKFKKTMIAEYRDLKLLLRSVPSLIMVVFVLATMFANIFANKELLNVSWLALDCGFLLSWLMFLCMDILTKRFGAKAAIKLSGIAIAITAIFCGLFAIIARIGNNWAAFYTYENEIANAALNETFGGTWYVIAGSLTAMAVAAVVNAVLNEGIGKMLKKDNFTAFSIRSYVSTAIGQLVDNLVFATLVSKVFFGWTWTQVITCSIAGAIAELLAEVIFSPVGYRVCKKWESEGVGASYIEQ